LSAREIKPTPCLELTALVDLRLGVKRTRGRQPRFRIADIVSAGSARRPG
jgi:hypothetical protein